MKRLIMVSNSVFIGIIIHDLAYIEQVDKT